MRFAALQGNNANDYAAAGKKVANEAARSFAITRKYGPDYGKIAQVGMATRSKEKIASMEAAAQVTQVGINAVADVKKTHITETAREQVRNAKSSRKAGGLAALGSVAAAGYLMSRDNDKEDVPSNTDEKRAAIEAARTKRDELNAEHEANYSEFKPKSIKEILAPTLKPDESSKPDTSSVKETPSASTTEQPAIPEVGTPAPRKDNSKGQTVSAANTGKYDGTFGSVYNMAKTSGAKYPELVAAQWQLESGGGKAISGTNNFFGIKAGAGENGTVKGTWEESGGKAYNTNARFKNFASPQASIDELVGRWHKDYKDYKGVNNSTTAADAARSLKAQGYATDSKYSDKLIKIMSERGYGV